jgi:hypothetical protein
MSRQLFYLAKSTGTYADTLAAFGLAEIVKGILEQASGRAWSGERIWIRDDGPYYVVELAKPLPDDWAERCHYFNLAQPISTSKQQWNGQAQARDYGVEWEKSKQYFKAREKLGKAARKAGAEDLLPERPTPDSEIVKLVGDYKMGTLKAYNSAIRQWEDTRKFFVTNVETILELSATPFPKMESISQKWLKSVKRKGIKLERRVSKVLNPAQGEGQHHPKANSLNTRNWVKSFWLLEYLKAVGLWKCAAPRTVRGGSDRKVYVVSPKRISLGVHDEVFGKFGAALWNETAVKMDILAALQYAKTLIEYSEAKRQAEGRVPDRVISGLYVATYQQLNQNSYTAMNLAFIGIPEWIGTISTREEAKVAQEVIKEHLEVIRGIDEERSDGYNLLVQYRDFLSGGQLETFFDFAIGYGQYLMSEWGKKNLRVRPFTPNNLRRLIMAKEPKLGDIIKVQGFRNLATAIRHSTVIPQRRKARSEETAYEPEYNLGMELQRVAPFKDKFVATLGAFVQRYNAEILRRMENPRQTEFRGKPMRPRVAEQDLDELLPLIDDFGPEVICNLLLAYGYAWEYRAKDKDDSESQDD